MKVEFETVAHIEAGMTSGERVALLNALIGGANHKELVSLFKITEFTYHIEEAIKVANSPAGETE